MWELILADTNSATWSSGTILTYMTISPFFLKKKYYFYSEKWLETSRFVYVLDAFPVEKWG
jgi:hypothetical protein